MNSFDFSYFDKTISGKIKYYMHLSLQGKENFCNRVNKFKHHKEFEGMNDFLVTDEVKILISAAAVQLTFGLHYHYLEGHHLIRVYPKTFCNTHTSDDYKDLKLQQNLTVLSWEDFVQGYMNDDNHFNLGMYELSNILQLSVNTEYFDTHLGNYIDDRDAAGYKIFENMRKYPSAGFLRNYILTNESEFFSVCVEYFFEVPKKFQEQLPVLYDLVYTLLNQDPLNTGYDYRVQMSDDDYNSHLTKVAGNKPDNGLKEMPDYVDTFISISFFVGLLCFWLFIDRMKINFGTFCTIGSYSFFLLLVLTQLFRTTFTLSRINSIDIMRMILVSPFISLIIFMLNYFCGGTVTTQNYIIENVNVRTLTQSTDEAVVRFQNDALEEFPRLRTYKTENNTYSWQQVSYQFEKGLFGFQNVKSRTIINKDKTKIPY